LASLYQTMVDALFSDLLRDLRGRLSYHEQSSSK
jgi:hypothetical protein